MRRGKGRKEEAGKGEEVGTDGWNKGDLYSRNIAASCELSNLQRRTEKRKKTSLVACDIQYKY